MTKPQQLKFNAAKHEYKLGNNKLTPVTTFVKSFFPEFDAKAVARKLAKFPANKAKHHGVRYFLALWKKSADDGTETHKQIQEYIEGDRKLIDMEDQKAIIAINYWEQLRRKLGEPMEVPEHRIFSADLGLAGTIDLMVSQNETVLLDGRWQETNKRVVTLIDWKTNKEIKVRSFSAGEMGYLPCDNLENANLNHYMLQLATYAYLVERELKMIVKDLHLVHLKDNGGYEVYKFDYTPALMTQVEAMLKARGRLK